MVGAAVKPWLPAALLAVCYGTGSAGWFASGELVGYYMGAATATIALIFAILAALRMAARP